MALENVVLFGAGGSNIGHHLLEALVSDGTFNVSVLARNSSRSGFHDSVNLIKVADDFPHGDTVAALKGQDVVVCTSGIGAHDIQYKLIDAAIEAGVIRFIPSEWGIDNADPKNQDLCPVFKGKAEVAEYLHSKAIDSFGWTAVATSIWLDWSLDEVFIGIDPTSHSAQYWCNGTHTPSHTTLPYVAQAVLQILKHPDFFQNQRVFLSPFQASQREIVARLEKEQGVKYLANEDDSAKAVEDAKFKWRTEHDPTVVGTLVSAGVLLPGFGADFVTSKKSPILEELVEMPKLTLEEVIQDWVIKHPETIIAEC